MCFGLKNSLRTSEETSRTGVHSLQQTPWKPGNIFSLTSSPFSPWLEHTHTHTNTNTNTLNRLLLSAHWFSLSVLSAHWLIVPQSVQLMALFLFSSCPDMKMPWPCVLCWATGGICVCVCYLCVCVWVWKLNPMCPRSPSSLFKWQMELV